MGPHSYEELFGAFCSAAGTINKRGCGSMYSPAKPFCLHIAASPAPSKPTANAASASARLPWSASKSGTPSESCVFHVNFVETKSASLRRAWWFGEH